MSPQRCACHHVFSRDAALVLPQQPGPFLAPRFTGISGQLNFYSAHVELHSPVWMCCTLFLYQPRDLTTPGLNQLWFYGGTPSEGDDHPVHLPPDTSIFDHPQQHLFCLDATCRTQVCPFKVQTGWDQRPFILSPSFSSCHPKAFMPPDTWKFAGFGEQTQMTESYESWNHGRAWAEVYLLMKGSTFDV